jgi:hypothetical protein
VWEQLLSMANHVAESGLVTRRSGHKVLTATKFTEQAKLNVTQRQLQEFRQDINDLRLALQVDKALRGRLRDEDVETACTEVARRQRIYKKMSKKRPVRLPNNRHVKKAYKRWFFEPGCIGLTAFPREPIKPT